MDSVSGAHALVTQLLRRSNADAQLADFVATPPDHYTLRIDLPGEIGKTLIVSRAIIEGASASPVALRTLRLLLRSAVLRPRSHRAIDRDVPAPASRPLPAENQVVASACDDCGLPILLAQAISVRAGRLAHRGCEAERRAS